MFADAVEVIGACAAAARRRLGVVGAVSPWQLASAVTGGRLLAPAWPGRVDQHELALGRGRLINEASRLVSVHHSESEEVLMAVGHDKQEQVRAERARAVGLFRYCADPGGRRPGAVHQAAGPAGPRARRA